MYQCGFSLEATEEARDVMKERCIVFEELSELPGAQHEIHSLRLALYAGSGSDETFSAPLANVLGMGGFELQLINDREIREGLLADFDILVVPGSPDAGECYYSGLGDKGYDAIRSFIAAGGHYIGVCGGAYLPLTSYHDKNPYWLNIVEATDEDDLDYWRSGSGFVRCRIDDDAHAIFKSVALGRSSSLNLVYWEGPAISIRGKNVKSLAHFEMLLASGKDPLKPHWDLLDNTMASEAVKSWHNCLTPERFKTVLENKCAIAEATFGKGRLLLYSPHPEMGNLGTGPWAESQSFLLLYNGLLYLSAVLPSGKRF